MISIQKYFLKLKSLVVKSLDKQSRILIKNSSWIFFENFFRTILVFVRSIVVARGLGVKLYGTYAIVVAFVTVVQEFFNLNIGTTIIKFGAEYKNKERLDKLTVLIKGGFFLTIGASLLSVFLIAILITVSYQTFFTVKNLHWYIIFYSLAASTRYIDYISTSILRLFFKFKLNSIIRIFMNVIEFLIVVITVIVFPRNLSIFFLAVILARITGAFICNGMAFWELRLYILPYLKSNFAVIKDQWKVIRNFTINNSVSRTIQTFILRGDVLLLGALTDVFHVGYYAVAKRLAFSILRLSNPLTNAIFPQFAKLVAERKFKEIKEMIIKISKLLLVPSILFIAFTYFFKEWIIMTVYGDKYIMASKPFFYLIILAVLIFMFFWNLSLIQSLGMVAFRLRVYIVSLAVGAIAAIILITKLGTIGAALSLLLAYLIITVAFTYSTWNRMNQL